MVVLTAARAATVERSLPRRYAGAILKPYLSAQRRTQHLSLLCQGAARAVLGRDRRPVGVSSG